ncbi:MAG: DNA polymerase II large subunit [Nitrososphaeraceae archaeon]|nr:DNA polymerase II large subunit [Nitrososphaeraceae archaeon]
MKVTDDAEILLKNIHMPQYYLNYQQCILKNVQQAFEVATKARKKGLDVSDIVETKIAYDLADRVAKMHNIDIANRLRSLLSHTTKEKAALKIAEEIAIGEYGIGDLQTRLNNAVRVSLAVVTEGVTVAPLQGIADVQLKNNSDGSQYLSISFAGPIRSAGGTEAALTMLIADHARKIAGVEKYIANSYDDETGRFIEELRIYEREVGNFQFKVLDEDVVKCIVSLPVELNGVDTDPVEVVGHRGMKRIPTDRVRGGALRVMNDGLIGRSRKLVNLVEALKLDGWDWLKNLKGAIQTGDDDAVHHRMSEVITGRPVLSMAKRIGGFRLRYGRCYNTGFATVGIHPAVPVLLSDAIVVGTQIKMDVPGKASTIALVDSIEPPIVRLDNGSVMQITTIEHAIMMRPRIEKILYLGDMLISYGDFLENNAQLLPSSYVEEIWTLELKAKLLTLPSFSSIDLTEKMTKERLMQLSKEHFATVPTIDEAFAISKWLNIPLYPKYSFYWDSITIDEVLLLKEKFAKQEIYYQQNTVVEDYNYTSSSISLPNDDPKLKDILERLGVIHSVKNGNKVIVIDNIDQIFSLAKLLFEPAAEATTSFSTLTVESINKKDVIGFISKTSGIEVKPKFASSIAVRVGRPEKAAERKMKPPVHVLFPIGSRGGATRDILKAAKDESFYTELANRFCNNCKLPSIGIQCHNCSCPTPLRNLCIICREEIADIKNSQCYRCGKQGKTYSPISYPLNTVLEEVQRKLDIKATEPLKGVQTLMSKDRAAEPLEKGVLRQKYSLFTFKDGTIRFDATNEPLTHFKPKWTMASIERLRELGYNEDYLGMDLTLPDQLVELLMQDIIIPLEAAKHLLNVAKFIDEELVKLYRLEPFYNASSEKDLVGHMVVGLAPHTSVGIIGRIIGFTDSQVCLASPVWHSAKRRDCDGDADSLILLMDAFLNFSYDFLPDKIGGLMDAPLLIQPLVLPYEVQRQAHNVDVVPVYPLEFYESTWKQSKAGELSDQIETIRNRIGSENQFFDYAFTHPTGLITTNGQRSAYSRLNTMDEKLEMQIAIAKLINAVDPDEVVSMVLVTHILPDIMGNMRSYSSQAFRCGRCGEKYRRMPIIGKCLGCENELLQTVTRGSVEKYIGIATNMCNQFKVNDYLRSRVESLIMELKLIFKERKKEQSSLIEFMG